MLKLFSIIILLTLALCIALNAFSPAPSFQYDPGKCTRYCHNKGCEHFISKYHSPSGSWLSARFFDIYQWNIEALKHNWFGLSYQQMNIALYVVFFPLACLVMGYTAFKK